MPMMDIFNNYLMFKLLFDGTKRATPRTGRHSLQGAAWRNSCTDVSQAHQPLRQRLALRRRSGSWAAERSTDNAPSTVAGTSNGTHAKAKSRIQNIGRIPTVAESHPSACSTPEIQITPVDKKPNSDLLRPESQSAVERTKQKLTRKRSGSLPETQTENEADTKNKLVPPVRFEAPATLDPKRKVSAPSSFLPTIIPTAAGIPELIQETAMQSADFVDALPSADARMPPERPVSAMASLAAERPVSPGLMGPCLLNAGSSPSLLDLYLSASRKESVANDYSKMIDELDSVVLDLGYSYNKPVRYAQSSPIPGSTSDRKTENKHRSCSLWSPSLNNKGGDEEISPSPESLVTPPPTRATVSRETSKGETPVAKRTPLIESVVRKLRSLKRNRSSRDLPVRSDEYRERSQTAHIASSSSYVTTTRGRWNFLRSKKDETKISPPSIFIQNMMGSGGNNSAMDKHKTSGTWRPLNSRSLGRTLSYKRSTSAPSPRFTDNRRKSNAADYSTQTRRLSSAKKRSQGNNEEAFPADPINDLIEARTNLNLLSRSHSPLLHPGYQPTKAPELLITMSFSQATGFITATINKARNVSQNSEVFIRIYLFEGTRVLDRKQTPGIMGKLEPEFKQAYVFTLGNARLAFVHFLVEVRTPVVLTVIQ